MAQFIRTLCVYYVKLIIKYTALHFLDILNVYNFKEGLYSPLSH